jgi:hypothetical protein
MRNFHSGRLIAAALLLCTAAPVYAQAVEGATATTTPWSGWWWPAKTGNLVLGYLAGEPGAMVKHDQVTGRQSAQWEESNASHFDLSGPDWWGHCHAWAAASILEPEPRHGVYRSGVLFNVGDIKGLLAEAHYSDQATFFGQRYNGNAGDDFEDMYPFTTWQVLRQYVNINHTPIVMDLNPGPEVWSYPVYMYQLSFQPIAATTYQAAAAAAASQELRSSSGIGSYNASFYQGQLTMMVADFEVNPDFVGVSPQQHNYTFVFAAQGSSLIANSDHWTGASVQDHPDFAWYPTQRVQGNTQLDYTTVSQLDSQAH